MSSIPYRGGRIFFFLILGTSYTSILRAAYHYLLKSTLKKFVIAGDALENLLVPGQVDEYCQGMLSYFLETVC
jgi:hypothetical protein